MPKKNTPGCTCCTSSSGACTGNKPPIVPTYGYFACPNGGFGGHSVSLPMTQGTPPWGSGVLLPVYPLGGGIVNHHVTFSNLAWYTPFTPLLVANPALGAYSAVSGGVICLYFTLCQGYLITIFYDGAGNPFVYDYDLTWTFPLTVTSRTVSGLYYGPNTNSPFSIGQATTTQSGSGPALTGQFGPILSGGTGTSVFPAASIGVPTFST
jgi:hypothetical protein